MSQEAKQRKAEFLNLLRQHPRVHTSKLDLVECLTGLKCRELEAVYELVRAAYTKGVIDGRDSVRD